MFLKLQDIDIGYRKALIERASAELDLGDVCLLMGNNGTGKTTLIKSILGQQKLLNGKIFFQENDVHNLTKKSIAERVSIVFSKSNIPANYTLVDLISLGKFIHYPYYFELSDSDLEEVHEIIDLLQLHPYTTLPLHKLSDGNLQKAFIGRALAQKSPMIILDEPTTHLDEENKLMILKLLRHLAKTQNKLILFSSHDWRVAKSFADKIWLIKNQKLSAGVAEDIIYQHSEFKNALELFGKSSFPPPNINAPEMEKQLLLSLIGKHGDKNLSQLKFEFQDNHWIVNINSFRKKVITFEHILRLIEEIC